MKRVLYIAGVTLLLALFTYLCTFLRPAEVSPLEILQMDTASRIDVLLCPPGEPQQNTRLNREENALMIEAVRTLPFDTVHAAPPPSDIRYIASIEIELRNGDLLTFFLPEPGKNQGLLLNSVYYPFTDMQSHFLFDIMLSTGDFIWPAG